MTDDGDKSSDYSTDDDEFQQEKGDKSSSGSEEAGERPIVGGRNPFAALSGDN